MKTSFFGICLWAVSLLPALATAQPQVPETIAVERQAIPAVRQVDGLVEAVNQATVASQTSGRITEILFDVDDYVERNQVIARFGGVEQRARADAAQAALNEAQARQREAASEFERVSEIFKQQLVSRSVFDKAQAGLDAANARLKAARARLQEAREALEHTQVRAPYAGIVVERHVEVGELANVGTPLMTGLSLDRLRVVAHIPQQWVNEVRAHGQARIRVPDHPEAQPKMTQLTVFPYADPKSHTIKVRLDVDASEAQLFPGMYVKVGFLTGEVERLLIPRSALVRRSEVSGVYVLDGEGDIRLRQVRQGRQYGEDQIEILAGLEVGEQVALDPIAAGVYLKERLQETRP